MKKENSISTTARQEQHKGNTLTVFVYDEIKVEEGTQKPSYVVVFTHGVIQTPMITSADVINGVMYARPPTGFFHMFASGKMTCSPVLGE